MTESISIQQAMKLKLLSKPPARSKLKILSPFCVGPPHPGKIVDHLFPEIRKKSE